MSAKLYLHLLLFCGILCQEIFATLADENVRVSSDLLVRKRRVINHFHRGQTSTLIQAANYVVKIKESNRFSCAGSILSRHTVITAASCVLFLDVGHYKIFSGSAYDNRATVHGVTSKAVYDGNPPHKPSDGIALITVDPPFVFSTNTGIINLYTGPLSEGTHVTVFGWGCKYPPQPGPDSRVTLRTITLPIMNLNECQSVYRHRFTISQKNLCTYDTQQYCARNDAGAPLVINRTLAGIHVWKGEFLEHRNPDVFINLQSPGYIEWIREHVRL